MTFGQLFTAFSVSCSGTSVFKTGLNRNPYLFKAVLISGALQIAALYIPGVNTFLKVVPLSWGHLGISLAFAILMLPVAEILKFTFKRGQC